MSNFMQTLFFWGIVVGGICIAFEALGSFAALYTAREHAKAEALKAEAAKIQAAASLKAAAEKEKDYGLTSLIANLSKEVLFSSELSDEVKLQKINQVQNLAKNVHNDVSSKSNVAVEELLHSLDMSDEEISDVMNTFEKASQ